MQNKKISVVIPVYNGEGSLQELADRLVTTLQATGFDFEIIKLSSSERKGFIVRFFLKSSEMSPPTTAISIFRFLILFAMIRVELT